METRKTTAEGFRKIVEVVNREVRRAKKLGLPAPRVEKVREYTEVKTETGPGGVAIKYAAEIVEYQLIADPVVIRGWRYVASLAPIEGDTNAVMTAPDYEGDLSAFRHSGMRCDHCNKRRKRGGCVVVQNVASGEYKQVGKGCLTDFVGGYDADGLAAFGDLYARLENAMDELGGYAGCWAQRTPALATWLRYVGAAMVEDGGYVKTTGGVGNPTAWTAWALLREDNPQGEKHLKYGHMLEMGGIGRLAEEAAEWAANLVPSSDFEHTINAIAKADIVTEKTRGIAAAILPCYQRTLAKRAEQEAEAAKKPSEYVGEVGDRLKDLALTVRYVAYYDTDWGSVQVVSMVDADNNIFVWKAHNKAFDLNAGDQVVVTGTVKKHDEYKGRKQTVLSRCKLVAASPEVAKTA